MKNVAILRARPRFAWSGHDIPNVRRAFRDHLAGCRSLDSVETTARTTTVRASRTRRGELDRHRIGFRETVDPGDVQLATRDLSPPTAAGAS